MSSIYWVQNLFGASQPWRVASEEQLDATGQPRHFVLKNFCVGEGRPRYVEYVATQIAATLQTGAPRPTLLDIDQDFIDFHRLLATPPSGITRVQLGPHVAIPWYSDANELVQLPYGQIPNLRTRTQIGSIVGADTFLQNEDRHRSNILVRRVANAKSSQRHLVPIDWGAAWEGREINHRSLGAIVEKTRFYPGTAGHMHHLRDPMDFAPFRDQLEKLVARPAAVRSLVEWVPDEWAVPDSWKRALHDHIMRRGEIVLETLLRLGDRDHNIPDWQFQLPVQGER